MQFDEGYTTCLLLSTGGYITVGSHYPLSEVKRLGFRSDLDSAIPPAPSVKLPQPEPPPLRKKEFSARKQAPLVQKAAFQTPNLTSKSSHCTRALLKAWLTTARSRISRAKSEAEPEIAKEIEACLL